MSRFGKYAPGALALFLCILFVATGALWIERPGVQSDEALFSVGMWGPFYYPPVSTARIFGHDYALMVMSYVGSLKAHLMIPVFAVFGASPASIRIPPLVLAGFSVWFFYLLVKRTLGVRAALIGTALLATDTLYLVTARLDWGPVAIQHLSLTFGLWALTRGWTAAAFFAFGLGMWDKALFAWSLAALGVAGLALFPREIRGRLSVRTVVVAALAFAAGAYPLIRYNVKHDWVTFRSNAVRGDENLRDKAEVLRYSLDSTVAGGPILREHWDGPQREPRTAPERWVEEWAKRFGNPHANAHFWLLLASVLALPLLWRTPARRAISFSLFWMTLVWVQMAWAKNGGTSTHHTVLLWPMPLLAIAAALSRLPARAGVAVATCAVLWNLTVTASFYSDLNRFGGQTAWTDAVYPLNRDLMQAKGEVCALEWGFFDNIRALSAGKLSVCVADDPVGEESRKWALLQMSRPGTVFIGHTTGNEIEKERKERILAFARESGFRMVDVRTYKDSNGRDVLFTYRLEK